MMHTVSERLERNGVDYVGHKRAHKQAFGFFQGDSPRAQIEEGALIELACRCAVRTLHIVAVDEQLWLGMHSGGGREQQVAVGLVGVCAGCSRQYRHKSLEGAFGTVVEHEFKQLV